MFGELANEVGAMGNHNVFPAPPTREVVFSGLDEGANLVSAGVLVATTNPLVAHSQAVGGETCFVSPPHDGARVILPAPCQAEVRTKELQHLHPLLAESLSVKHLGALGEC